jgi:hypothetical protein
VDLVTAGGKEIYLIEDNPKNQRLKSSLWQTRSEADQENMGNTSEDNLEMAASKSFLKKVSVAFVCLSVLRPHPP